VTTGKRLPYPGLRAFHRDESDLFFGREDHVDKMVDRLTETRFLAVLGPSGGGKSSLVKTGLLDALDLGYSKAGTAWCVAYMKPGSAPIRNLAAGLLAAVSVPAEPVDIDMLAALLRRGPRSIAEWAGKGNLPAGHSLLILADQFEELFRYGDYAGREEAEAFVKLLLEAARTKGLPLYVCITMRSEFLGACSMIPGLAEAINDGLYLTPRLSREQCKEAIVGPAGVCGFDVEPDLVNKILNDMAAMAPWSDDSEDMPQRRLSQRADQLPLMQHVLNRMWLATARGGGGKDRPLLTRKGYEALGGLKGALDIHGKEILDQLGPHRHRTVEGVFRALTTGVSLESAVRRPCTLQQLTSEVQDSREDVMAVIEAFRAPSANFLQPPNSVPIDDATPIDISHESLIRQWSTLSQWFTAEAQSAATWRDLLDSKERYEGGRGDLLSGLDLAQASAWWAQDKPSREWSQRHGGDYDGVREFLQQSEAERDQGLIEAERRALSDRKRLKIQLVSAVAALAIVAGLGVTSLVFWQSARAQAGQLANEKAGAQKLADEREEARARAASALADSVRSQRSEETARRNAEIMARSLAAQSEQRRLAEIRARQAAARANASEVAAQRRAQASRALIDTIGGIISGSDASFNASSDAMRQQISQLPGFPRLRDNVPVRATTMRQRAGAALAGYLQREREMPGSLIGPREQLRNSALLWEVNEGAGDIDGAARALRSAWESAAPLLERDQWDRQTASTRGLAATVAYEMAWNGPTFGFIRESQDAIDTLQSIGRRYGPTSTEVRNDPTLALALGNYENLASAIAKDNSFPIDARTADFHAVRAVEYATVAIETLTLASVRTLDSRQSIELGAARERLITFTQNLAYGRRGDEHRALVDRACELSDQFLTALPLDRRGIRAANSCARERVRANPRRPDPLVEMIATTSSALERDPESRQLIGLRVRQTIYASSVVQGRERHYFDMAIRDLNKLVSTGYVSGSVNELDSVVFAIFDSPLMDNDARGRLADGFIPPMRRLAETHPRSTTFGPVLARFLTARANSVAGTEAELEFRRL
jgi:hypothetical protein